MSELVSSLPVLLWAALFAAGAVVARPRAGRDVRLREPTPPMRGELLGADRLEQLAVALAAEHRVAEGRVEGPDLLARLDRNRRKLYAAYRSSAAAVEQGRSISPAAEWLLDNFHIVQEQLREAREDLPRRYYGELPRLAGDGVAGLPRVYALAVELVTHTDSRLDVETLSRFIAAYQRAAQLTTGELWAVPIALRLALVENLGRLATRIERARREREAADSLADDLIRIAAERPGDIRDVLDARVSGRVADTTTMFAVELLLRLRDQDPALVPVVEWLERRLATQGSSVDETIRVEHQSQSANQVSVGNIIGSMRTITATDWAEFVESLSAVDAVLREDPLGFYDRMDFATRDAYRHVVERIAKRTRAAEADVARAAVGLARAASEAVGVDPRKVHVGYYLVGRGRAALDRACGYRPPAAERLARAARARPTLVYLGSVAATTAALLGVAVWYAWANGGGWLGLVAALVAALPAGELAVSLVNSVVTHTLPPARLPKLDFSKGVPESCRTFVVVPTLLTSANGVRDTLAHLEVQYLANADPALHFAVLGDFADADAEHAESDDEILQAAIAAVRDLNARYGGGREDRFYLFQRRRVWSPGEGRWMGWERKRGKLHEFNRLLAGARDTSYTTVIGDESVLPSVRYVLTLDADTVLPRDAAAGLVGTAAHPLNEARLDPRTRRVVEGYGILQPRVSTTLESSRASVFASVLSGAAGVDPYTTAVSDVYQDLFGEGSYTGKGLYDPRAFEEALEGRVPENQLLSHDLFEGCFARSALVSDVELFDDCPSSYLVQSMRRHRWTRGDWQLLPWLGARVPVAGGGRAPNVLPLAARWKIFDNLRRSLVAPAIVLMLVCGWVLLPGSPLLWTLAALAVTAFPIYAHLTASLLNPPGHARWSSYVWSVAGDAATNTAQVALLVSVLPHHAWVSLDAIARSLWRQMVTRRGMLEWTTAAQAERIAARTFSGFARQMWVATATAAAAAAAVALLRPAAWPVALPFVAAWAAAPAVALWVSRPRARRQAALTEVEVTFLRRTARKTWRFFETFMTDEDNWLPPDNFQEEPLGVVAHRTSPTNMGLALLADVAARDLGYRGLLETTERLELTLSSMERLERVRGHFLNWYDTTTLAPLNPWYVSTVDSGNLAGHLVALEQACLAAMERPLLSDAFFQGLEDALLLLAEETSSLSRRPGASGAALLERLREESRRLAALLGPAPGSLGEWVARLEPVVQQAHALAEVVYQLDVEREGEGLDDLKYWAQAIVTQTISQQRDLETLAPWAAILAHPAAGEDPAAGAVDREALLAGTPSLADLWERAEALAAAIRAARERPADGLGRAALATLEYAAGTGERQTLDLLARLDRVARRAGALVADMDFAFLLDPKREIFSIGYNVRDGALDNSYYDLLASESRLASFVAIAKGDAPERHWFRLGRALSPLDSGRVLKSWTGTMFEYLMPLLVMRDHEGTLLGESDRAAVRVQVEYASRLGVPWGVSEAAYNAFDLHRNYQYGPFGVPGLGIKRGLGDDLVVAPYATALAALVAPKSAVENLSRLSAAGLDGPYGFYESIDYTPSRVPRDRKGAVVRAYMAHHQGMTLVALNEVLSGDPMRRRFHTAPAVQATELLLQERVPRLAPEAEEAGEQVSPGRLVRSPVPDFTRHYGTAKHSTPRVHLLSNGSYSVMVTTAGGGYSRARDAAVSRWREDVTRDDWGQFLYLRDADTGRYWSAGYQPTRAEPEQYEVTFSIDKAEFRRVDDGLETHVQVSVSTEDDAEVRRVTLTNLTTRERHVELTSYFEVVLATPASDVAHPAFGNLFVQTEFAPGPRALLATRRARSSGERPLWGVHVTAVEGAPAGPVQYETDRSRFCGRGRGPDAPVAVVEDRPLSNTAGSVLDPIMSIRRTVTIAPGASARVLFTTAVAADREAAVALAEKYADPAAAARALELAWTNAHVELRYLGVTTEEAHMFLRLASRLLYVNPDLRARPEVISRNTRGQSGLWAYGVSGDLPVVVVRVAEEQQVDLLRQLLRAHEFWRLRGLAVDLVVLNEHPSSYRQEFHDLLLATVRSGPSGARVDKPGGVFVRRADLMPDEDRTLFLTVARAVLVGWRGTLAQQIERRKSELTLPPQLAPSRAHAPARPSAPPRPQLDFFNGVGGFSPDGREYVVVLGDGQWTPAPWSNVVANERFGFLVTESGGGYTWCDNSRENRLTPWSNDPVEDPAGEAVYLRDEETGVFWSPTPHPARDREPYVVRHGQGYTAFEHTSEGVEQRLVLSVPERDPVKLLRLELRNASGRPRRLTATYYLEWVLGVWREASAPYIVTSVDEETGAFLARNPYNNEFAAKVAFVDATPRPASVTAERKEFVGRNGRLSRPNAMARAGLSGRTGAGYDPCAALQVPVDLAVGETKVVTFVLGEGDDLTHARALVERYRDAREVSRAFDAAVSMWDETLGRLTVETPDKALDAIVNRWLLYQTLSCRVWARTAFYQSGGAYGFRDQLQDVAALVHARPEAAREQLLRAAAHQFVEGDVQHWWHPPTGRGVRTRFSDDLLWLPLVAARYVRATGDAAVLDEEAPFVEARALAEDEHEAYLVPETSGERASLYEHCCRAVDRSLAVGRHGLPLMGSGDWNDGMNRVGAGGKGESVWVGWFLHLVLEEFAPFAEARGDAARAARYREHADRLRAAIEHEAWDGEWYVRAFFDDGTPLGSSRNEECKIDSIAQSWSVISGAGDRHRRIRAMAAVEEYLVRRGDGLIMLFTPPFDRTDLDPGYIKGYVPGVRENGGQYTHAAVWVVMAYAMLGDGDRAGELFALLNPVNHAATRAGVHRYKVEPYVAAADVYAVPPHTGRGGWTWYTGSAGWMYRVAVESILGVRAEGDALVVDPCIPRAWPGFRVTYRHGSATYRVSVENPSGVSVGVISVELDGERLDGVRVPLADDGREHLVRVMLGEPSRLL